MTSLFVNAVAVNAHKQNITKLHSNKSKAEDYLEQSIRQYKHGRDDLIKLSEDHYKLSSSHKIATSGVEGIHAIKRYLFDQTLLANKVCTKALLLSQPAIESNLLKVLGDWDGGDSRNLTLANYQLFYDVFNFYRDVIKQEAQNHLYQIAFNVLDTDVENSTYNTAKNIITVENSKLRNCRTIRHMGDELVKASFMNYFYDSEKAFALNVYNTENSLEYLFENDFVDVCYFYNLLIREYNIDNTFTFTPESLIECYHPIFMYSDLTQALHKHSTNSIEPDVGTPAWYVNTAIDNQNKGLRVIEKMTLIRNTQKPSPSIDITPPVIR